MARVEKITEKAIERLEPKVATKGKAKGKLAENWLWEGGFGVKVTPAGNKVFYIGYRIGGREAEWQKLKLGDYGKLTLTQARKQAATAQAKVALGDDPAEQKRKAKRERRESTAAGTLRASIERYAALNRKGGRYWKHKEARLLGSDMTPVLDKPVRSVAHSDMLAVLDNVKARSENAARLLLVDLRPFFKWAVPRIPLDSNPMDGVEAPKPAESRERVLELHEVAAFWQAAGETAWPFASIYKLLLLTGARREEVAGMRWSELDAGIWELPGERTKNGRPHRVPLAPAALALLDRNDVTAAKARLGYPDSDLVFSTTGKTPPSGWSKAKLALDGRMKAILGSRFKPWRIHDLRRTCATGMEDLGIPTHVVETALNHVSGAKAGIVGVYQRAEHREAVKSAFAKWEQRVMEIVGNEPAPSNVVPLRKLG